MKNTMPTEIDAFEFTRSARSAEGCELVSSLDRLAAGLANRDGSLSWRLDGWRQRDASSREQMYMRLRASGTVGMACGRCLGVVSLPVAIDRGFLLVQTESEAAGLDEAEEEIDVLVASRRFQVIDLLEDEAILALPPAASHAQCERPTAARASKPAPTDDIRPKSPFAALQALKPKPPS
jgi:uncharacterized protein